MNTLISAAGSPMAMPFKSGAPGPLKKVCNGQALLFAFRRRGWDYVRTSSTPRAG